MSQHNTSLGRALLLATLMVAAIPGVSLAQPVLNSFSFTPNTINTSGADANVTVNFSATDTGNLNYFEMAFVDPTGVFVQRGFKQLTPSTSVTDSVTVSFPRFSSPGTWTVLAVFLADSSGKTLLLNTSSLASAGFPTNLQVVTTAFDTTPPNITAFSFSPSSIDVTSAAQNVTVNFTATDDLSGVASVYVGFVSPSGELTLGTRVNAPTDFTAATSVTGSFKINFPQQTEAGTWTVSFINVVDVAGNTIFLATPDLLARSFPTNLVVNKNTDTTAPVLTSSTISPTAISGNGGTVTVNFSATDDLSGVTDVEVSFTSPTGAQVIGGRQTTAATLSFSGSVALSFPSGSEPGMWTALFFLSDEAGNTRVISQANALNVTPPGVTPPLIVPTVNPLPNGAGWNNSFPVTVSFAVSDPTGITSSSTGCAGVSIGAPTTSTTVTCTATNTFGLSTTVSVVVKIDIAPPVVTNQLATPNPVIINNDVTVTATVTDAGGSNVMSAEFSVDGGPFDDLAPVSGQSFGNPSVNVSLTLPASATPLLQTTGVHNMCYRGTDFAGNISSNVCVVFAVYDPGAGFTTGGGNSNSPAGSDLANPNGSGPVSFGFNLKYLPNNPNIPSGDLEFHYDAGKIDLKSTSWDFLVVSNNGTRAQAQGTGTINGTSVCKFSLDAWSGSFQPGNVDALGLTIFNCSGGSGNRYNLVTAPITHGSIKVHQ